MSLLERRDSSKYISSMSDTKKALKKRKYVKVDYETRTKLIVRVLFENRSIRKAAKEMGMNFSTAKAIIKIFREEGRILKKAEQGDYDVSYKMFEKAVFKMLHQKNKGGDKKLKDDDNVPFPQRIMTDLKALLQDKTKLKPQPMPQPAQVSAPVEEPHGLKELQGHKGFQPFQKVPSQAATTTTSQEIGPISTVQLPAIPNLNIKDYLMYQAMKSRLANDFQQQLFMKSLAMFQARPPQTATMVTQMTQPAFFQPMIQATPYQATTQNGFPTIQFGNLPTGQFAKFC